jgi:putative FmdB family regulatory protein
MPTYEYRCEKGHLFERVQKMSDRPVTKCPVCGAKASRMISGGQGLIFKGTGFYITDYGKDGKGARKDPDSASVSEAKGESKTEARSASKTDSKPNAKAESRSESVSEKSASKSDAKGDSKPAGGSKPGKPDAP